MKPLVECLIVDDEPLAVEVLKSHISKLDSLEITGVANDAFEAFDFLNKQKVDLMFLDIHMPAMKGTDLLKTLKNPPSVVLTTAYREYALEGFDLNVLDYLLKPISFERFLQAVEKFNTNINKEAEITLHNRGTSEEFLYLREKNLIHKIPLKKIVYAESMGDYATIHTIDSKITNRCTISSLEKVLSENGFLRIHRSYIVSLFRITSFSPTSVYIEKNEFPIGTSYKKAVFDHLDFNGFFNKQ